METNTFYPKNKKTGAFWKIFSFLLLTGGSSGLTDIEEVVVDDKITIKTFLAKPVYIGFNELRFVSDSSGKPKAITGLTQNLNLSKMEEPEELVEAVIKNMKELGYPIPD